MPDDVKLVTCERKWNATARASRLLERQQRMEIKIKPPHVHNIPMLQSVYAKVSTCPG